MKFGFVGLDNGVTDRLDAPHSVGKQNRARNVKRQGRTKFRNQTGFETLGNPFKGERRIAPIVVVGRRILRGITQRNFSWTEDVWIQKNVEEVTRCWMSELKLTNSASFDRV